MTDNEKRAHDFAVALVPLMTDFRVRGSAQKGESDVYLDPYHEYRNVYDSVLESFNRDFPDGR